MEYDFELRFKLASAGADTDALVELLGKSRCDDALIGVGQPGRIALSFTRRAISARRAVVGALRDVKRALPAAALIEVGPDFVGLTDVAEHVGVTRQNMRKLMLAHVESFPAPVHEGSAALWHLAPVLHWLQSRCDYPVEQSLLDVAHIAMQINLAKEVGSLEAPLQREVRALIA